MTTDARATRPARSSPLANLVVGFVALTIVVTVVFFTVYAVVLLVMAATGLLPAAFGRARPAGADRHVSVLYAAALTAALLLFYAAIPFVVFGMAGATLILGCVGLFLTNSATGARAYGAVMGAAGGGTWAVLRSVFVGFDNDVDRLRKTDAECPRLFAALREVAERVGTEPIDEVYLVPGSSIGVFQHGCGPFGLFGHKRRVLVLGLSTLRFLSADEMKAILAHEYAHFRHRDTRWVRFLHQASLSLEHVAAHLHYCGGWLTYLNPFFWFFYLYEKAYALLAAGFSREREYLADRVACELYGSDVFASALTKVCTRGVLFERAMSRRVEDLVRERKAFVNVYRAFQEFHDSELDAAASEVLHRAMMAEAETLFSSHPSPRNRFRAAARLPPATAISPTRAVDLLDDLERAERDLTDQLTRQIQIFRRAKISRRMAFRGPSRLR